MVTFCCWLLLSQILLTKAKNRFAKVIEIIEQEKQNYKFRTGTLGQDSFRCTIGLILSQILLTKAKNRFAKVIEIIEQEKQNYKFRTGTLGQDSFRCTIGLILSH